MQERKSSDAMKKFKNLLPTQAMALRDGVWQPIEASTLVRGDIVRVQSGDKVPADIRITRAKDLKVLQAVCVCSLTIYSFRLIIVRLLVKQSPKSAVLR